MKNQRQDKQDHYKSSDSERVRNRGNDGGVSGSEQPMMKPSDTAISGGTFGAGGDSK
jgi:hypothetical protein